VPTKVTVGYIRVTHLVEEAPEGGYVSRCPELGIASQGESIGEAFNNLRDATYTYLNTIEQLGDRERIFKERRIVVHTARPSTPVRFDVEPPQQAASIFVAPIPKGSQKGRQLAAVG